MPTYSYSIPKNDGENAKALGRDLAISTKSSIEICNAIRHKPVARAKRMLEDALSLKTPIKFTRFSEGAGHKQGLGMARFPVKACQAILKIVESAEANAQTQGLGKDLVVFHARAQAGTNSLKFGRQSRRFAKRTHIEIAVKPKKKEAAKK